MAVKAIQLLMNEGLPEDMRDYNRTYDSASIKEMMTKAADLHPDEYADIIKHIMDVGRDAAYYTGQTSKLSDYKPIFDRKKYYDQMDAEIDNIKGYDDLAYFKNDYYGCFNNLNKVMKICKLNESEKKKVLRICYEQWKVLQKNSSDINILLLK